MVVEKRTRRMVLLLVRSGQNKWRATVLKTLICWQDQGGCITECTKIQLRTIVMR